MPDADAKQAVDHLNLRLGIVHGAITPFNLFIARETDSIQLFNFEKAAKLGCDGDDDYFNFDYDKRRNDVKFVILTVYDMITRQLDVVDEEREPRRLDETVFLRKRK
jgi:RIO-like serine/threonine protein kinase